VSAGPIVKDWQYYTFWGVALLAFLASQGGIVYLLARILAELRK
jgi:hypothetical protein